MTNQNKNKKFNNHRLPKPWHIDETYADIEALDSRLSAIKEELEAHQFNILAWPAMGGKNYTITKIGNQWVKEGKRIIFATNSNLCLLNQRMNFVQSNRIKYTTFFAFGDGKSVLPEQYDPEDTVVILDEVGMMNKEGTFWNFINFLRKGFKVICLGDPQQINMTTFLVEIMSLSDNLNEAIDWTKPFNQNIFGFQYNLNAAGKEQYPYVRAEWLVFTLPFMQKNNCLPHLIKYDGDEHPMIKKILDEGFENMSMGHFEYHRDWRYTTITRALRDKYAARIEKERNARRQIIEGKYLDTLHAGRIFSGQEIIIRSNSYSYRKDVEVSEEFRYYNGDRADFLKLAEDGLPFVKLKRTGAVVKLEESDLRFIYPSEITTVQLFQGNHEDRTFCHIFNKGHYTYNSIYAAATRSTQKNLFLGYDPWRDREMTCQETSEYLTKKFATPQLSDVFGRLRAEIIEHAYDKMDWGTAEFFITSSNEVKQVNDEKLTSGVQYINLQSSVTGSSSQKHSSEYSRSPDDIPEVLIDNVYVDASECSSLIPEKFSKLSNDPAGVQYINLQSSVTGSSSQKHSSEYSSCQDIYIIALQRSKSRKFSQSAVSEVASLSIISQSHTPAVVYSRILQLPPSQLRRCPNWKEHFAEALKKHLKSPKCFDDWWYFVNPDTSRCASGGRFNRMPKVAAFVRDNPKIFGCEHVDFIREILSEYSDESTDFVKCFDICYEYMLSHNNTHSRLRNTGSHLTRNLHSVIKSNKPETVETTTPIDEAKRIAEEYLEVIPPSPDKRYSVKTDGRHQSQWSKNMITKKDAELSSSCDRKMGSESYYFMNLKDTGISVLDGDDKDDPKLKELVLSYFKSKGIDPLREESPDNYGFHILGYSLKKSTGERTIHTADSQYKADFLTDKRNQALFRKNKVTKGRDFVDWNEHIGFLQQLEFKGIITDTPI